MISEKNSLKAKGQQMGGSKYFVYPFTSINTVLGTSITLNYDFNHKDQTLD